MIKDGYYFGSHMTGSISNQFTNEYREISLFGYMYCHSSFRLMVILTLLTSESHEDNYE